MPAILASILKAYPRLEYAYSTQYPRDKRGITQGYGWDTQGNLNRLDGDLIGWNGQYDKPILIIDKNGQSKSASLGFRLVTGVWA